MSIKLEADASTQSLLLDQVVGMLLKYLNHMFLLGHRLSMPLWKKDISYQTSAFSMTSTFFEALYLLTDLSNRNGCFTFMLILKNFSTILVKLSISRRSKWFLFFSRSSLSNYLEKTSF